MPSCHVAWGKMEYFAHGTLGHVIEHGQVKGSHITLKVQHENSFYLHDGATMCYGRAT